MINNTPDGTNINTNCGSTHIEVLQKFVVDKGLDIGFAYDGDADRCIAVDHRGNVIDGDKIMYVCGKYLKEEGKLNGNKVVTTVMSNLGLYKAFDREGIGYEQTAVGDKYVAENMLENNYSIGGEQSGHIIFSRYCSYRRWYPYLADADGGMRGKESHSLRSGKGDEGVSPGAEKCACG